MLKKLKESSDKGDGLRASFTGLFKAIDCIPRYLLIAKLSWYEVTTKSLNLIFFYLRNRTESVRLNKRYSD